jgi:pentatricopeptide repeat protein
VFDELEAQTIVSWNSLIAGYAQHGPCEEALSCYERMQKKGFSPDVLTFASVLKACGSMGAIDKGEETHADILKEELQGDALVGNALVDMYAKCGAPAKAREVFEELPARDVVAWTALISGYSQIGHDELVTDLFNRMVGEGVKPDLVACTIVLNACSRSGLLDRGELYFEAIMSSSYGIAPTVDHCTCIVDMFGRAGQFGKVLSVVEKLPSPDYLPFWATLLGACHKWGNVELGRMAFERVVQLDEKHCAAYVLMSNIYASAGLEGEAQAIEALRAKRAEAWD